MTQISEHFWLSEFTRSSTARRLGIDNTPSQAQVLQTELLVRNVLQPMRGHFGRPVRINSGIRVEELNRAVGGSSNSDHMWGRAADFEDFYDERWNYEYGLWLQNSPVEFKQLIWEFGGEWLHISYQQGHNRGEVIEAYKDDRGRTRYRPFKFEWDSPLRHPEART